MFDLFTGDGFRERNKAAEDEMSNFFPDAKVIIKQGPKKGPYHSTHPCSSGENHGAEGWKLDPCVQPIKLL